MKTYFCSIATIWKNIQTEAGQKKLKKKQSLTVDATAGLLYVPISLLEIMLTIFACQLMQECWKVADEFEHQ